MEKMEIHNTLFSEEALFSTLVTPDFLYIHKELLNEKWRSIKCCYGRSMLIPAGILGNRHTATTNIASYIRIMFQK